MSEYELWNDLDNIFNAIINYQKKNIEFNNRFINPWIRLGNIYGHQNQNKEAVQAYQQATEIDPDTAQNWKDLGDSQFKNGDYLDANSSYKKAISLDPKAGWPLSNLALTLVTQGKYEEAIPLYTASIELLSEDKDKAIIWNRLGNAYRKLNKYEDAYIAFQKADELDGENTGFSDKLDEYPAGGTVIASEEILEQMVVEQPLEAKETPPAEVDKGAVNKARADGGNAEAASMQTQVKRKEDSIKDKVSRIPSWLIFNESEQFEKEVASTEKAITISEDEGADGGQLRQEATFSEPAVTRNILETDTVPVPAKMNAEMVVNEKIVEKIADALKIQNKAYMDMDEEEFAHEESVLWTEANLPEEETGELAYEEYLKDVVEPSTILPAHIHEVNSESSQTKLSANGEIRIAMDTTNAHVWNEMGNVYFNSGSYDDAIASFSKAIELDRQFAWAYSNLALAYVQIDRITEAILLYQRSIELFISDKDKAVTWNRLGNAYRRMNDYSSAIAAYKTADELDPANTTLSLRSSFGLLGNMSAEPKPAIIA